MNQTPKFKIGQRVWQVDIVEDKQFQCSKCHAWEHTVKCRPTSVTIGSVHVDKHGIYYNSSYYPEDTLYPTFREARLAGKQHEEKHFKGKRFKGALVNKSVEKVKKSS